MKALITTVPFALMNQLPLELLKASGIKFLINPLGRKLTEDELTEMVEDFDIIIAGTEPITQKVIDNAPNLKLISRVGIGLDSVDLLAAQKNGIKVSYTPDAPAPAVAELTLGLIFSLLRSIHVANSQLHKGQWNRIFGKRLSEITLGVIGVGRIGSRVIRRTKPFGSPRLLVNDINPTKQSNMDFKLEWVSKQTIYEDADIICIHLPLTRHTHNLVTKKELLSMKSDAAIINVSRGGIINENSLYRHLFINKNTIAFFDVFEKEPPLNNKLLSLNNFFSTPHIGGTSEEAIIQMGLAAIEGLDKHVNIKKLLDSGYE